MKAILFLTIALVIFSCQENDKNKSLTKSTEVSTHNEVFTLPKLPEFMIFAGQRINLTDEDIRERLEREVLVNAYFQSSTVQSLKRAGRYFPAIEKTLKSKGVPDDFKYLAVIESGLTQAVSPAGAQGFWQFMPFTAADHALEISDEVDERLHIQKSTEAACDYLLGAQTLLKDWLLTAASYNRGIGGVQQDMKWQRTTSYFDTYMNSETARYVFRILAVKLIFEDPISYGYDTSKIEIYKPFQTKIVSVRESIPNLAEWSISKGINYKILIKLNPWLLGNKLTINGNKQYTIELPVSTCNLKPYKFYK